MPDPNIFPSPERILAQAMARNEVILSRGTVINDGKKIGIDFGGPGQYHILFDDPLIKIHVDADSPDDVRQLYVDALVDKANEVTRV